MATCRYALSEIEEIAGTSTPFELPKSATDLIKELAALVGAPTYVRTPVFHQGNKNVATKMGGSSRRRGNRGMEVNDDDWETIRHFEATKQTTKEGPERLLDQIRKSFNKISEGNYASQIREIMANIDLALSEYNEDMKDDLVKLIMKLATGNIFFAKLYSKIIVDLNESFEGLFTQYIEKLPKAYLESIDDISTCKPEEDYDRFCKINEDNERRRATGVLLMRLSSLCMLGSTEIHDVMNDLVTNIQANVDTDGADYKNEELAEMLLAIVQNGRDDLTIMEDRWETFSENIHHVTSLKVKEHVGLSNKCLFKCMDIRDLL